MKFNRTDERKDGLETVKISQFRQAAIAELLGKNAVVPVALPNEETFKVPLDEFAVPSGGSGGGIPDIPDTTRPAAYYRGIGLSGDQFWGTFDDSVLSAAVRARALSWPNAPFNTAVGDFFYRPSDVANFPDWKPNQLYYDSNGTLAIMIASNPGGWTFQTLAVKGSGGDGSVVPASLISNDTLNTLTTGSDGKLKVSGLAPSPLTNIISSGYILTPKIGTITMAGPLDTVDPTYIGRLFYDEFGTLGVVMQMYQGSAIIQTISVQGNAGGSGCAKIMRIPMMTSGATPEEIHGDTFIYAQHVAGNATYLYLHTNPAPTPYKIFILHSNRGSNSYNINVNVNGTNVTTYTAPRGLDTPTIISVNADGAVDTTGSGTAGAMTASYPPAQQTLRLLNSSGEVIDTYQPNAGAASYGNKDITISTAPAPLTQKLFSLGFVTSSQVIDCTGLTSIDIDLTHSNFSDDFSDVMLTFTGTVTKGLRINIYSQNTAASGATGAYISFDGDTFAAIPTANSGTTGINMLQANVANPGGIGANWTMASRVWSTT
jgi:hypothetical protein